MEEGDEGRKERGRRTEDCWKLAGSSGGGAGGCQG